VEGDITLVFSVILCIILCNWILDEIFFAHVFCLVGFLAPIYSHAFRKLKMLEIPVVQRKLIYTTYDAEEAYGSEGSVRFGSHVCCQLFLLTLVVCVCAVFVLSADGLTHHDFAVSIFVVVPTAAKCVVLFCCCKLSSFTVYFTCMHAYIRTYFP
jgi:hypothetical protein